MSQHRDPRRHEIGREYIVGRIVGKRDDGSALVTYPSLRDLCRRHNLALSVVGRWARVGEWTKHRKAAKQQFEVQQWAAVSAKQYRTSVR